MSCGARAKLYARENDSLGVASSPSSSGFESEALANDVPATVPSCSFLTQLSASCRLKAASVPP